MLTALETGVKGGKWFRLIDKVYSERNLQSAFWEVWRNDGKPGVDGQTVKQFVQHEQAELAKLAAELHAGSYRAHPSRRAWIPKLGSTEKRPLGIPAVRDRVVQAALRHVLEPIFEREFAEHSYGFRPGRGCKDALRRVDGLLTAGYTWVVDADLKSYFDSISHERLLERVREHIADGPVLRLIENYLKAGVLEGLRGWQPSTSGTPQGAVISPLLANLYLNPLDHTMAQAGRQMVRYADDFVILCQTKAEAEAALAGVRTWVEAVGLRLHPEKIRIVDATQRGGFDFLGYHFERGRKWPRRKSLKKLRDRLRGPTRRSSGQSLPVIVAAVNPTLRGWFAYFKHSLPNTFAGVDGWVRMRLRSILRKRNGGKGRGRGADHQRWPNAYFATQGLYSLVTAHAELVRQSHVRPH
jgi:RNA-directed DNA polymerase